jgi:hypothetical protein
MLLFAGGIIDPGDQQLPEIFNEPADPYFSCQPPFYGIRRMFFRNGGEYYLMANLIVIIIYFNERIYIVLHQPFKLPAVYRREDFLEQIPIIYTVRFLLAG